ncbi:BON domain-containing protein [Flavobacterium sp.]|uniref:BON domain-containing protein n=1 Tax=Flavobacterium sp. TaxID=239 RepID=UPI0039E4D1C8
MKTIAPQKTNEQLQQDVEDAIKWEPALHAAEIGVTVKSGIVTLTGTVNKYQKKMQAEEAAKNVAGVLAVVEKIEIRYANSDSKTDFDIAQAVIKALGESWNIPPDRLKVKVENGDVYLSGTLPWDYQRQAAKRLVEHVDGIKALVCSVKIESEVAEEIEKQKVIDALFRHASINPTNISVEVSGSNITLKGTVSTLYQKEEAAKIAWKTPGVSQVDNQLKIYYDIYM